jgi:hypothetical protein
MDGQGTIMVKRQNAWSQANLFFNSTQMTTCFFLRKLLRLNLHLLHVPVRAQSDGSRRVWEHDQSSNLKVCVTVCHGIRHMKACVRHGIRRETGN